MLRAQGSHTYNEFVDAIHGDIASTGILAHSSERRRSAHNRQYGAPPPRARLLLRFRCRLRRQGGTAACSGLWCLDSHMRRVIGCPSVSLRR